MATASSFSRTAADLAQRVLPAPAFRLLQRSVRTVRAFEEQRLSPAWFARRVRHLHGPTEIDYGPDEALLMTIVRDGEAHIRPFLEHHFALGLRHVLILDNGSVDATVEIAREYDGVTILTTEAPYARYENVMKRYLARRYSTGRWNLIVDVDERFDYVHSDTVPLRELLRYLNANRYDAVVAHMLDLFPTGVLGELGADGEAASEKSHVFYDLGPVRTRPYRWGAPGHPEINEYQGGIRHVLFGVDCGLTKAPLVRVTPRMELFVAWHHTRNAHIADFDALLRHYPFVGFHEKVAKAIESWRYGEFTRLYQMYQETLQSQPERMIAGASAHRYTTAEALLDAGFLVGSDRFLSYMARCSASARMA
jgi:hypothetical protein